MTLFRAVMKFLSALFLAVGLSFSGVNSDAAVFLGGAWLIALELLTERDD